MNSSGVGSSIKNKRFDRHTHTHIYTHTHTLPHLHCVHPLSRVVFLSANTQTCTRTLACMSVELFTTHTHMRLLCVACGEMYDEDGWAFGARRFFLLLLLCVCVEFVTKQSSCDVVVLEW